MKLLFICLVFPTLKKSATRKQKLPFNDFAKTKLTCFKRINYRIDNFVIINHHHLPLTMNSHPIPWNGLSDLFCHMEYKTFRH